MEVNIDNDSVVIKTEPVDDQLEENNGEIAPTKSKAKQFWDVGDVSIPETWICRDMSDINLQRVRHIETYSTDLDLAQGQIETRGSSVQTCFKTERSDSTSYRGQNETSASDVTDYQTHLIKMEPRESSPCQGSNESSLDADYQMPLTGPITDSAIHGMHHGMERGDLNVAKGQNETTESYQVYIKTETGDLILHRGQSSLDKKYKMRFKTEPMDSTFHQGQNETDHNIGYPGVKSTYDVQKVKRELTEDSNVQSPSSCYVIPSDTEIYPSGGQWPNDVDDPPRPVPGTILRKILTEEDFVNPFQFSAKSASELPVVGKTTGIDKVSTSDEDYRQPTKKSSDHSLAEHEEVLKSPKPVEERYQCKECKEVFACEVDLIVHKRDHWLERILKCDECGKIFAFESLLEKHQRIHTGERPFKCDQCDKTFNQENTLMTHQRIHTGEKPFKCYKCDKAFELRSLLTTHGLIHTGKMPFKCDQCEETFEQKCDLMTHQGTRHMNARENPYKCSQCDQTFLHKRAQCRHKRTHAKERPFVCVQCDKTFTQKSHLRAHQRIHTGEKPFRCDICRRRFAYSHELVRHKNFTHTVLEKPLKHVRTTSRRRANPYQ